MNDIENTVHRVLDGKMAHEFSTYTKIRYNPSKKKQNQNQKENFSQTEVKTLQQIVRLFPNQKN